MANVKLFDYLSFNSNKATGITITSEADPGEAAVSLTIQDLPAGTYKIAYAFQCTFGSKDKPCFFGLVGDNEDANMFAITSSANDALYMNRLYGYPFDWPGGAFSTALHFYKDSGTTFVVDYTDLVVSRVG